MHLFSQYTSSPILAGAEQFQLRALLAQTFWSHASHFSYASYKEVDASGRLHNAGRATDNWDHVSGNRMQNPG